MDLNEDKSLAVTKTKKAKEPKKKHYGWRMWLCFFAGMVVAVGVPVGTVAVLATVTPAKNVVNMFGGNANDILGADYQDSSIMNMVMSLANKKFETLGDINDVTPLVKKTVVETINPVLKENIHYEFVWDELAIKPFVQSTSGRPAEEVDPNEILSEYVSSSMKEGITLASFLDGTVEFGNVIKLFLYPTIDNGDGTISFDYDNPYSLEDYLSAGAAFFDNVINKIRVGDIIDTDGDPFLSQIASWTFTDFTTTNLMNLKIGGLFTDEQVAGNILLQTIKNKNWSINDLANPDILNSLKISELFDLSSASSLMQALADFTIEDLTTKDLTQELKVSDIYPDATEGLMYVLRDKTISELSDKDTIMSVKLKDLFDIEPDNWLYDFREKTLEELTTMSMDDIKLTNIFSASEISSNPILNALVTKDPDTSVGDLSDYSIISSLLLSDILSASDIASSRVLTALVNNGATIANLSTKVNELTLNDVVDKGDDPTSVKYKIITALGSYSINEVGDHFNDLKMSDLFEIDSSSAPILQAIKDETIDSLPSALNSLTIGDVVDTTGTIFDNPGIKNTSINDADAFEAAIKSNLALKDLVDIDSSSPEVLQFLANCKLDEIADTVEDMTLGDMISIDSSSPQILQSLAGVKLFDSTNNLEYALTNLKFNQVYTASDCTSGVMASLWNATGGGNFLISDLGNQINLIKLVDLLEDKIYEPGSDPKKITPTWWFLLTEEGETFTSSEKYYTLKKGAGYTLNDMDKIVTNMEYHMKNESILNLVEAGFITIDPSNMTKLYLPFPSDPTRRIGDLTITEFSNYLLSLI